MFDSAACIFSELKEAERQKTVEKDSKILELKKANRKFDEHVKKLSTEKLGLGEQIDSLKNEVMILYTDIIRFQW